jgi:hypothetical protein
MLSEALLAKKIVALIDEDGNGGDGDGMVSVQELQVGGSNDSGGDHCHKGE